MSEMNELSRALKEQSERHDKLSAHFGPGGDFMLPNRLLKGKTGPGGGTDIDPLRAAYFLLAVLDGAPRKDAANSLLSHWYKWQEGSHYQKPIELPPVTKLCPMTGEFLFGKAVAALIERKDLASRTDRVEISSGGWATIYYDNDKSSRFVEQLCPMDENRQIIKLSVLDGSVIKFVADMF